MVVTIANASVRAGHTVGVCLLVNEGPLVAQLDARVQLHTLKRKWRLDWAALKKFARITHRYDLLHVHLKHNVKYVYVADRIFRLNKPVLLHDHSAEVLVEGVPKTKLPFFVVWWLRKQHYLAVSEQLMQWAIQNFKLSPNRAGWLGNAIECKPIAEAKTVEKSDAIKLLLVSNFRRIKNIEFAVALVAEMLRQKWNVTLDIVGKPLDEAYYTEIVTQINSLKLSHHISIRQDVDDVDAIITEYTLGLHCSHAETGPLVLLEYMCAGLPFVSYLNGEISLFLRKACPCVVLDTLNIPAWIERIKSLSNEMTSTSEKIQQVFAENYSIVNYALQIENTYKVMVN